MRKKPPRHKRQTTKSQTTTERGLGWRWQKLTRRFRNNRTRVYCVRCWEVHQRVTPMQECHHVVPRSVDMTKCYDITNVRPLCQACHEIEDRECQLAQEPQNST